MTTKSASLGIGQLLRVLRAHDGEARTDGQLLERFLVHQDEAAFATLVRRHGPMMFGVCRRILGNDADSEDAFQAAFLVLVRRAPSLTSRSILGDWLHGVARYTALKARAAATHRQAKEQAMARPDATAKEVRNDWLPLLDEELARLPEKYRLPIVLCDLEGKTRHEAAEQLGWPPGTVAGRLARARTMLAKSLARHGVVFSGGALAVALSQNMATACVPGSLLFSTVKAASMAAAGKAVAGVVSTKVATLTEGVMKAMFLNKLKTVMSVLFVVLGMVVCGGGLYLHQAEAQHGPVDKSPAVGQTDQKKGEAPQKQKREKEGFTAWGKEVGGLQAGLRITGGHGRQLKRGEQIQFDIVVRNNTDKDISFTDHAGKRTYIGEPSATNTVTIGWMVLYSGPGPLEFQTHVGAGREIRVGAAGIYHLSEGQKKTPDSLSPGKYQIVASNVLMYTKGANKNPELATGTIEIELVKQAGADASLPIHSLPGHKDRITSVAYSSDGQCITTAGWDGTIRLWDPKSGKELRRLDVPPTRSYNPAYLSRVLFSPDSKFVMVAQQSMPDEPGVIVWDRRTGKRVRDFPGQCVAIAPDGKHIACGGWGAPGPNIRLYEFATGKLVREIHNSYSRIEGLVYSRDGKLLFASVGIPRPPLENGLARLGHDPVENRAWDVATGKERRTGLDGAVGYHLAVSPDGRTLALANSLRETATGGQRVLLTDHSHGVCAVAFSPDGRTVASAGMDGTVRLWGLPSGKEIARFGKEVERGKGGWVLSVAFSPDGRTLVSGGLDKKAHIWEVSRITGRKRESAERSPADLETDWKGLAGDAATGYAALSRLVLADGSAVAFLGKQLQSIKPVDTKRIERLLADLDSDKFAVREQATRELQALAEHAVPALRTALTGKPSLETSRRLEALLHRLESATLSAETVRQIRAVEALESIGNPDARRLLDKLAAGPPELRLTYEARAAAARLARQVTIAP